MANPRQRRERERERAKQEAVEATTKEQQEGPPHLGHPESIRNLDDTTTVQYRYNRRSKQSKTQTTRWQTIHQWDMRLAHHGHQFLVTWAPPFALSSPTGELHGEHGSPVWDCAEWVSRIQTVSLRTWWLSSWLECSESMDLSFPSSSAEESLHQLRMETHTRNTLAGPISLLESRAVSAVWRLAVPPELLEMSASERRVCVPSSTTPRQTHSEAAAEEERSLRRVMQESSTSARSQFCPSAEPLVCMVSSSRSSSRRHPMPHVSTTKSSSAMQLFMRCKTQHLIL